jgi:hypothetical protein
LITHRARPRHLLVAAAVYAPLAVLMFTWPGLIASVTRTCGAPPFDVRGFWNADDARVLLASCGSAGRTAYIQLQLADLAYPAALAWLLLTASALLLRRFGGRTWPILLPIIAMTALDYAENAGIWALLLGWPDFSPMDAMVANIAGVVTAIKRVLGFVAFSTPIVLSCLHLALRLRQRVSPPVNRR